jgi:hypothetical protein
LVRWCLIYSEDVRASACSADDIVKSQMTKVEIGSH